MINLTESVAGLPPWPTIEGAEDGSRYYVHGKHLSYGWYAFTRWLVRGLAVWGFWEFAVHTYETEPHAVIFTPVVAFVIYTILVNCLPLVRWLAWLLFRRETRVAFTAQAVTIRGHEYPLVVSGVQFRTWPTVDEKRQAAFVSRPARFMFDFRNVEMIYGARIVHIATMAREHHAEQFALALSIAYDLARKRRTPTAQSLNSVVNHHGDDDGLPE